MTVIFVDADACPVRDEVFRVAGRLGVRVAVVSNGSRPIRPTGLDFVDAVVVEAGADAADDWIAERIGAGDVCATADIPLASRCLLKGAKAVRWDGREWTGDNIGSALTGRAVGQAMREAGQMTGGPAALTKRDRAAFADALHRVTEAGLRGVRAMPSLRSPEV